MYTAPKKGLGLPWLGGIFALLTAVAAFGIGNMVQANSVAEALQRQLRHSHPVTGIVLVVDHGRRDPRRHHAASPR